MVCGLCAASPIVRSGAAVLSLSVTTRRRGIQRELPSSLTNGQEEGKMFHLLTVFFSYMDSSFQDFDTDSLLIGGTSRKIRL